MQSALPNDNIRSEPAEPSSWYQSHKLVSHPSYERLLIEVVWYHRGRVRCREKSMIDQHVVSEIGRSMGVR